jgi:hypothetical protein
MMYANNRKSSNVKISERSKKPNQSQAESHRPKNAASGIRRSREGITNIPDPSRKSIQAQCVIPSRPRKLDEEEYALD